MIKGADSVVLQQKPRDVGLRTTTEDGRLETKTVRKLALRFVGEAVMIVVSVYAAIVLEGISSDRGQRALARESLRTVRAELLADQQQAQAYARQKLERAVLFSQLSNWLNSDGSVPADSFGVALEGILTGNVTAFPKRAAWTTMVSQGQLEFAGDAELVGRLADLYDRWADRVTYNGQAYDEALWSVTRTTVPSIWDRRTSRFLRSDREARLELDGQLFHLEIWNDSYGALLDRWAKEIGQTLVDVDQYLELSPLMRPQATAGSE
jgi:Family of unknown function (DUF6090)